MQQDESIFLLELRRQIEDKSQLGAADKWKQRDYISLIDLIYTESAILLSLSTLRRIWKDKNDSMPHPGTLNALSVYAGYKDWYDFKKNCSEKGNTKYPQIDQGYKSLNTRKNPIVKYLFFVVIIGLVMVFWIFIPAKDVDLKFVGKFYEIDTIPANVDFKFASKGKIQEDINFSPSIRSNKVVRVDSEIFNYIFQYPGKFQTGLYYGDRIMDTMEVFIKTQDWISIIYEYDQQNTPSVRKFYSSDEIYQEGFLSLNSKMLKDSDVSIGGSLFTQYYFVTDPLDIDPNNFRFQIKLKSDSIYNYPYPQFHIGFVTGGQRSFVAFAGSGFEKDNDLRFSDIYLKGNTTDLSMFTTNVYSWMNITIDNINKNVSIFDNSTEIFKLIYKEPIDTIYGFHISFLGTGRIDEVILSDRDGDLIYYNDFLSGQKE